MCELALMFSFFVSCLRRGSRAFSYGNDSYEQVQQRREAAIVLDSPELLMMHAQARNDVGPLPSHFPPSPALLTKQIPFHRSF